MRKLRLRSMLFFLLIAVVLFVASTTFIHAESTTTNTKANVRKITVSAGEVVGKIKSLTGYCGSMNVNTMRQLGITELRTHDTGAIDIASSTPNNSRVIFPNLNADPNNAASYNFTTSDTLIKNLVANGITPFIRIGNGHDGFVPPDFKKYAEIVRHVIMHYNKGWANGFNMGIKNFEIWNEPDMTGSGFLNFWKGTPQQFYQLYGEIAKAIKSADSTALVGGPCETANGPEYRSQFLDYVKKNNLPLDFFTYHHYDNADNNPYNYVRYTEDLRKDLDKAGYKDMPIMLTEWGYDLMDSASAAHLAAYTSASLSYMQDTSIAQQHLEVLTNGAGGNLVSGNSITSAGYAFAANSSLQATPKRLKVEGTDTIGFTTLAGIAASDSTNSANEVRVLITNYEIPEKNRGPYSTGKGATGIKQPIVNNVLFLEQLGISWNALPRLNATYTNNKGYDLTVNDLPAWASSGYTVNRYRIDSKNTVKLIESKEKTGSTLQITADDFIAPAVELIVIRDKSAGKPTFNNVLKTIN